MDDPAALLSIKKKKTFGKREANVMIFVSNFSGPKGLNENIDFKS